MDKSSAARVIDFHKPGRLSLPRCVLSIALVAMVCAGEAAVANADEEQLSEPSGETSSTSQHGRFSTLYEPSGVVPLADGRYLIVEDEPERALRIVTARISTSDVISLEDETELKLPSGLAARLSLGVLDDLEGAAHDQMDHLYVVSSHDDSAPYWSSKRQKLLRFSIRDGQMSDVTARLTLRQDLLDNYPQLAERAEGKSRKKSAAMNIEALAYDRRRDVLLIGLRAPVLDGKAIIIRLKNPEAYLNDVAQPELDKTLWTVDVDKGGLRAMTYDHQTDQFLLVSRREDHKDDSYKLWRLSADGQGPAVRIGIGDEEDMLDSVEGLAPMDLGPSRVSGMLFVRDNGNARKGRGGDWFVLDRRQLGLGSASR